MCCSHAVYIRYVLFNSQRSAVFCIDRNYAGDKATPENGLILKILFTLSFTSNLNQIFAWVMTFDELRTVVISFEHRVTLTVVDRSQPLSDIGVCTSPASLALYSLDCTVRTQESTTIYLTLPLLVQIFRLSANIFLGESRHWPHLATSRRVSSCPVTVM